MTDNQDSKISDAVQPPTDRPLTAGDLPIADMKTQGMVLGEPLRCVRTGEEFNFMGRDRMAGFLMSNQRGTFTQAAYRLARPATSAASEGEGVDAAKIVERLAYGYAIMHTAICHMAGTSGADGRWYYDKANEAFGRISPIHALTERSNPHVPGDYYSGLSSILAALASPPVSERERELEGALREALPYLEVLHSTSNGKEARGIVWRVIQQARALTAQPAGEPTHG